MYNILIVDDDKIEREGVKFLLSEYLLPFSIAEAPNGKAALSHLQDHDTDVLFTDIKIPFIDGLELAEKARELNPNIKIVIFSAYGEFEYAKKAIELKAIHYILKPIDIPEFLHVMQEVIDVCKKEEKKRLADQELAEASLKAERYEKEKLLMSIISGSALDDRMTNALQRYRFFSPGYAVKMILVDIRSRFFDKNNDRFLADLGLIIPVDFECLNLNERQSVLFLKFAQTQEETDKISEFIQKLNRLFIDTFQVEPCLVISKAIVSAEDIADEYNCLENTLNYKFYKSGSLILYTESKAISANHGCDSIDDTLEEIKKSLYLNEIDGVKSGIDLIVESLKQEEGISPIYAKSVFIDIIKLLNTKKNYRQNLSLGKQIDTVIHSQDIESLKNIIFAELNQVAEESNNDFNQKTVKKVRNLVHSKYFEDISLEWIADHVFLSAGYLSYLFKKETGISLVKYIAQYRLDKAKELLDSTNFKVNDIAERVGYSDPSYFSMVFKNHIGISPNRYRERSK